MKKVLTLIGGISRDSLNRRFFEAIERLAKTEAKQLSFTVFDVASLPFFSQDLEADPPREVVEMRRMAAECDALFIVTPEYNRSIPGVLKNALDWGSRPPEKNVWARKPAAIAGASTGAIGTFGAQQHLRNVLSFLDVRVMNQPTVYFNASTGMTGNELTDSSVRFLSTFLAAFEQWIETAAE